MTDRPGISLEKWFPLVDGHVPTPKTVIIKTEDYEALYSILDGGRDVDEQPPEFWRICDAIKAAADDVGGPPFFLRTGLGSGKHEWIWTCNVVNLAEVPKHVTALAEWSATVDMFGLDFDVWVVREMLKTEPAFTAFEGFPVTRERRWFVDDDQILGWQPYWPPAAFEGVDPPRDPYWRAKLDVLNAAQPGEVEELRALTLKVGALVPGAWSVDWLWTTDRGWVLTDMAHAERSFVWHEWPDAPKGLDAPLPWEVP